MKTDMELAPGLRLSAHASLQIRDRAIRAEWITAVLQSPEFVREDQRRPGVMLAFGRVPEIGHRWLRVAFAQRVDGVVVVTAFFDRGAEKRR